jgi:formamidopyrimidine-DNA glycosylase
VPELPEVEVLVRYLRPLLRNQVIHQVHVRRPRVLRPNSVPLFSRRLKGACFDNLSRRGKFLLFTLSARGQNETIGLIGHLGMTGRMYLLPKSAALPKHTAVWMDLKDKMFVFEDTRYFGRLTLETEMIDGLGPEPLSQDWTADSFADALRNSRQPIKIKLLDQRVVAGVGNIYASEALFRSGISPKVSARRLGKEQVLRLWQSVREVLSEAIERGSSQELNYASGSERLDDFFYFGRVIGETDRSEHFFVYGRLGQPCFNCGHRIRRLIQVARSSYYCPRCQSSKSSRKERIAPNNE